MLKRSHGQALQEELLDFIGKQGPVTAKEICRQLGISQPVFSRLISKLSVDILVVGKARATQYAIQRTIPDVEKEIPLYEIDQQGKSVHLLILHPILPHGFYVESKLTSVKSVFYRDLPYFLDDLCPSGFLGRLIPKQYPQLKAPEDIRLWTANQCLQYLTKYGWDLVGNYILGKESFHQYLLDSHEGQKHVPEKNRKTYYEEIANDVLRMGLAGSSAAGEQPKFLTILPPNKPVLVKFSPPLTNVISQRRGDLLVCEHIAHQVLKESGFAASESLMIKGKTRLFLEISRFDRTQVGRKGLITLDALNSEFVGSHGPWHQIARSLMEQQLLDKTTYDKIYWLEIFGQLIANTDRHLGNISFFTQHTHLIGLAPVYDMVPMLYAPEHEQIMDRIYDPPLPDGDYGEIWKSAWKTACDFWKKVATHKLMTSSFKMIAKNNLKKLVSTQNILLRLPE